MILLIAAGVGSSARAENRTDASLFMKSDSSAFQTEIQSKSGDLYLTIGHHGPAVENEWMALRIYFNQTGAIDVYNKARPGLELKDARWYPDAAKQKEGWGADYYKVGKTVGLGGVRLWDGKKVVMLNPVSMRTAKVMKDGDHSVMEMISEGVPYKDRKVDILLRVTVRYGSRFAEVEAEALTGGPVRFVTGINQHPGLEIVKKKGMIATWGTHPEDVAAEKVAIGAALIYNPDDFVKQLDDGTEVLLISKSTAKISTKIISACAREPEINTMKKFMVMAAGEEAGLHREISPSDMKTREKVYYPAVDPAKGETSPFFRDWPAGKSPTEIGKKVAENFLSRGHYQDHKSFRYPDAIVWFGALKVARETGDNALAGQLIRRFDKYLANPKTIPAKFHVDYAVLGVVPLELYRLTHDPKLKALGMRRANEQWLDPTADGVTRQARYWVDDIYMISAIQTTAYRVTNDMQYLDRAALAANTYLKRLQKEDGLFWHAEDSPFVWGRGVGWYAAGMTEILKVLPASHPHYRSIMEAYKKMMAALLKHQAPSGLWRQLVDKPDAWEETSGSGMFAYAMVTGIKRGWLDPSTYGLVARKAWLALTDQLDEQGNLRQVCVGTNKAAKEVGPDLAAQYRFYLDRPRVAGDYHGQAPLLWTAAALLENDTK